MLPLPRLLELVFVAIRRTFFNETPTARLDEKTFEVNTTTGVATGQIVGSDPDGDRLTYRLKTPPAQGGVEVRRTARSPTHRRTAGRTPRAATSSSPLPSAMRHILISTCSAVAGMRPANGQFSYSGSNNAPLCR